MISFLYSDILRSPADSLRSCCMWFWMSDCKPFVARFLISTEVVYWQRYLAVSCLVPREAAAVSAHVLCTPYNLAPVYSVTSCKALKTGADFITVCLTKWLWIPTFYPWALFSAFTHPAISLKKKKKKKGKRRVSKFVFYAQSTITVISGRD